MKACFNQNCYGNGNGEFLNENFCLNQLKILGNSRIIYVGMER